MSTMHKNAGHYFIHGMALILFIILVDQYTKWFFFEQFLRIAGDTPDFLTWLTTKKDLVAFAAERENFTRHSITRFLNITMVWNQGISFGLFSNDSNIGPLIFIGISILISVGLIIWLSRATHILNVIAISFITGGAIGNVLDRMRFGAVADFIDLHYNNMHWPAFNIADICICFGAFLVVLYTLFFEEDDDKPVDV